MREPRKTIFFRDAIFEITFDKEGKFSNSQEALIFHLPLQEYILGWRKIKILKAPIGIKNIEFDPNTSKYTYLSQGFVEVEIGIATERNQSIGNNTQS